MAKSKIFLYFCLSFAGGIFLNSVISISQLILLGFLILGIIFISAFWKYKKFVVLGFCFLLLVFGVFWHQRSLNQISQSQLQDYNLAGETIEFTGQVVAEPDVREKSTKLTIQPEGMEGKVLVTVNRYLGYQYGDRIKVKGKLEAPYVFEEFNYKEYLAKEGIYSVVYFPEIELIENNQGNFLLASIFKLKDKLRENIDQNLSLPQSSILAAVILGDKRQISDDWKEKLNLAGVRHLTAVSGMHVSILTALLMSLLIGLGFWKRQAFFLTIGLIGLYVLLTGLQPSAVRAGIMGSFFLLANFLGRGNISSRTLVLAAVLMLLQNPLLLKWDVGFQLSFLAMIGIIYFLPLFRRWLRKIPNTFQLRDVLALTLSAQIFTLPILIFNFGYFSLVSPLTNILIVPLLPFIIAIGFVFAFSGMVFQPLGWLLSLPVGFLLIYLTKVVDFFSSFSFTAFFLEISWAWLIICYLILGLLTWWLQRKTI